MRKPLNRLAVLFYFLVLCLNQTVPSFAEEEKSRKVAIVIDDFGNDMLGTEEILQLDIPLTVAVMPFLPTTKRDAEWAYKRGHEVFIHLPMEPRRGKKSWLGPGAITTDLSDEEIRKRVNQAVDQVPHATGMNNHMGSKATADSRVMRIVLEVCKERNLIYLDSKTTHKSVIPELAKEIGVPLIENHIFLDDIYKTSHIDKQFRILLKHIQHHPECIAIGHVGPPGKKTAAVLKKHIPDIQKEAEFVFVSTLVKPMFQLDLN
ncbi:divergent polysaccharide deacetylase family protein [Ammoniphilus sp. CFH 90114]|uniref:divergent polysaccharide deacetylase family protein n=1 Tax=Ammoniphilus sp. CFH 90114 TaxID=2493665 RepID=UPI00100DC27C|nr:divergent polysaccharide deacetylase family protein [Ammoniphilus sp. CFH 90114]RXT06319.1 divergent polysaccharide deacetylase family protein [Ammoniphilus sp. CFH 90114]